MTATETQSLTLRELFLDRIETLIETEGSVPPELEAEYRAEVTKALSAGRSKVDSVVKMFDAFTESASEARGAADAYKAAVKDKLERLEARAVRFENELNRLKNYALGVILAMGQDEKGKWKPLHGNLATLQANRVPPSLEIVALENIPDVLKTAKVTMSLDQWYDIADCFETKYPANPLLVEVVISPNGAEIKTVLVAQRNRIAELEKALPKDPEADPIITAAIQKGIGEVVKTGGVPGARLITDKMRLVVK